MTRKIDSVGDGDTCPLYPEHGAMVVLSGLDPAQQFCPHVMHDGLGKDLPASRSRWPLYGFEDTVKSYIARLDRAIKASNLPDLKDLEIR